MVKHDRPYKFLEACLEEMAFDNGLTRTEHMPVDDCDRAYAALDMTASRLAKAQHLGEFVSGEHEEVMTLVDMYDARSLYDWLVRCFDGDLAELYFDTPQSD